MSAADIISTILSNEKLFPLIKVVEVGNSVTLQSTDQNALIRAAQSINNAIAVTNPLPPHAGGAYIPLEVGSDNLDEDRTPERSIFHRLWSIQIGNESTLATSLANLNITPVLPLSLDSQNTLLLTKDGITAPVETIVKIDSPPEATYQLHGYGVIAGNTKAYIPSDFLEANDGQLQLITDFLKLPSKEQEATEPPNTHAPVLAGTAPMTAPEITKITGFEPRLTLAAEPSKI